MQPPKHRRLEIAGRYGAEDSIHALFLEKASTSKYDLISPPH